MNRDDMPEQSAPEQPDKATDHTNVIIVAAVVLILITAIVYGLLTST